MKKRKNEQFRNSELARACPKRHIFHSLLYDKSKRHRTDTGLVEDSSSSTTIVRIIGGLLLVHLVVIGGVLLRGHMVKSNSGVAVAPTITPPPAQQAPAPAEEVLPQPTAAPVAPAPAPAAPAPNHITQAPAADTAVAVAAPAEPILVTPPPAPAPVAQPAPAAPQTVTVKHYVASGDTWYRIATQYGTTVEALQTANPKAAQKNMLFSGTYLDVPVKSDSPHAQAVAAENAVAEAAAAPKVHTVKRGETLGLIAKRNNISLQKLLKINNLTEKDARRIQVGTELKVSE